MHFKLTPVGLDKLTERASIPALRPGQEVGSHATIVRKLLRTDRPLQPPAGVCMGDQTITPTPRRLEQKGLD